jgi:hypothetical protein
VKRLFFVFVFALVVLVITQGHATTIRPMSVEQMTNAASTVVEAHALNSWSAWNAQHTMIYTYTRLQVTNTLKGSPESYILVKQIGGAADGYAQHVAGVRQLQPGEDAVLFLHQNNAEPGTHVIVGLMQGQFRASRTKSGQVLVSNGVPGAEQLQYGSNHVTVYQGSAMTLTELESRVRRTLQQ